MRRSRTYASVLLVVAFLAGLCGITPSADASIVFTAGTPITTGQGPHFPVIADFNGDTFNDVAVTNYTANTISIYLGDGAGNFTAASGSPFSSGGTSPNMIATGKFDAGNTIDLAVANYGGSVNVFLGSGTGTFTAGTSVTALNGPYSVAVANLNADASPDIVWVNYGANTVQVGLNNGSGAFTAQTAFSSGGTGPVWVSAGTLDAGTTNDLAVSDYNGNAVVVFSGNGAGAFTNVGSLSTASPYPNIIGNFGGTSANDIVVTNDPVGTGGVTSFVGNGAFGFGPIGPTPLSGNGAIGLASLSANADSFPDLVALPASTANFNVLAGSSTGGFANAATFPSGGANSYGIAAGNIDAGSKPDVVVTNTGSSSTGTTVSVYLNTSAAPAGPPSITGTNPASPSSSTNIFVIGSSTANVQLYKSSDCSGTAVASGSASQFAMPGLAVSVTANTSTTFSALTTDNYQNSGCSNPLTYVNDTLPPAAVAFTGSAPASPSNSNTPRIAGTSAGASTVSLYTTSDCSGASAASGTIADFNSPGLGVTVSDNTSTTFRAIATDAAGNSTTCSSATFTYVEDSTAPAVPTVSSATPAGPSNDTAPKIKGTSDSGTTVKLYGNSSCTGTMLGSGTNSAFASPGIAASVPTDATTTIYATATDTASNTSACSTTFVSYTEDSTPPGTPTIDSSSPGSPANNNSPKLIGTATGVTVNVYTTSDCSGTPVTTGTPAAFASPGLQVSVGDDTSTTFRVTSVDDASNVSACSDPFTYVEESSPPAAPAFTATTPGSPGTSNTPKVKGTTPALAVSVSIYSTSDCSGAPAATGSASAFASPGLAVSVGDNSSTTFYATDTDGVGNTSSCSTSNITYVEDSVAPTVPTLSSTTPASPADDNTPVIHGSAEGNSTVRIFTNADCSGSPALLVAAASFVSDGAEMSVSDDSTTSFTATATDVAGNVSACSSAITYTEDSTPPGVPTVTGTTPDSPANSTTPKVKGSAEAGSTVKIYTTSDCTGTAVTGTASAFNGAGITITVADGSTTTFYATATDVAGTSACSTTFATYHVDTSSPDTNITSTKLKKGILTVTFESSEPDDATFLCAIDAGAFTSCTSPFTSAKQKKGKHTFYVKAVDRAGNEDFSPANFRFRIR